MLPANLMAQPGRLLDNVQDITIGGNVLDAGRISKLRLICD